MKQDFFSLKNLFDEVLQFRDECIQNKGQKSLKYKAQKIKEI